MTTNANHSQEAGRLNGSQLLRVLAHAALRVADGEEVQRSWLIEQFNTQESPEGTRPSVGIEQQLLTVPEASAKLRISRWSIYDLMHKRQLLSVKIGRRRFVPSSELARYIKSLPLTGGQLL
ncbi:helix-turn-helix domain-containing protein [Nocardia asiatica]|uniref:helix-turn-helix domain-containing protein n=1 Tax=Nocardia asiatica TaxID=209252 RepID=UPI003EE2582C